VHILRMLIVTNIVQIAQPKQSNNCSLVREQHLGYILSNIEELVTHKYSIIYKIISKAVKIMKKSIKYIYCCI
jgi:hypothetical protein